MRKLRVSKVKQPTQAITMWLQALYSSLSYVLQTADSRWQRICLPV